MLRAALLTAATLALVLATACELPEGPRTGRLEVCIAEFFSIDPEAGEPYVVDDFVVREPERNNGCAVDGARLDVELVRASNSAEQMRIVVVEYDVDDEVVGEPFDIAVGTQLRVFADVGRSSVNAEVMLEDDDGLIFSAATGRDTDHAHLATDYAHTVSGPFGMFGCGQYELTATRFFDGSDARIVESGATISNGGFTTTNVASNRVDIVEGRCTDVRDGHFASWVVQRDD